MHLHPDWADIAKRSWSMRFIALAALGGFGEGIVQIATSGLSFTAGFAILIGCVNAGAAVARVVVQDDLSTQVNHADQ